MSKYTWLYQESWFTPTMIGLGWKLEDHRGWEMDELHIQFLFWKFIFVSDKQIGE